MATSEVERRPRDPDEFGIEINYRPNSDAPSRVFRTMAALIEGFQEIDGFLVGSIAKGLKPSLLLEDIEAGSLRAWLRNQLELVDDDTLKSGEIKKIVGVYLVRAKRIFIEWEKKHPKIESPKEIEELRQQILDEAARTDVLQIPAYLPLPSTDIVRSIELISEATKTLGDGDSVVYLSAEPATEFNRSFDATPELLLNLLAKETIVGNDVMILVIKRPDFLGDARWDFRWDRHPFEAKIGDVEWLGRFRNGDVFIHPGDALRCSVRSTIRYGFDGEVVDKNYEITEVLEVIHALRPLQGDLFIPQGGPPPSAPRPQSLPPSPG
jgi:hypothetical protein